MVRASDFDQTVTGSNPGQGAIKSPRLTRPSIPPGVGKSSTSLTGWSQLSRVCSLINVRLQVKLCDTP